MTVNNAIEKLLAAKQAKLDNEARPSEKAWYPTSLETTQKALDKNFETQPKLIYKDIAYTMQMVEFNVNLRRELYLSYPIKHMLNKQIVVFAASIIEGVLKMNVTIPSKERDAFVNYIQHSELDEELKTSTHELRKLRNYVHLNDTEELSSTEFPNKKGNEALDTLNAVLAFYYPEAMETFKFLTNEDLRVAD